MIKTNLVVSSNSPLTESVHRMTLRGYGGQVSAGQFVNLLVDGMYLRRPISVCDAEGDTITLVYKVVGQGTESMSRMKPGDTVDTLCGLGNGYSTDKAGANPLLIGGGVGIPPLYLLAKRLLSSGSAPTVVLGFNSSSEIFLLDDFRRLGVRTVVSTADGSHGVKGFVTDAVRELSSAGQKFTCFYTCGPEPMLRAVYFSPELDGVDGEFSFEERMGCGFGACMGCSCRTVTGYKRICADGPVLQKNEIIWRDKA